MSFKWYFWLKWKKALVLGPTTKTGSLLGIKQTKVITKKTEVVLHSQPTTHKQTVCKFHLDLQYNIFNWGSTTLGVSTLCVSEGSDAITIILIQNVSTPKQHALHKNIVEQGKTSNGPFFQRNESDPSAGLTTPLGSVPLKLYPKYKLVNITFYVMKIMECIVRRIYIHRLGSKLLDQNY